MMKKVEVYVALTRECYGTIQLEVPDAATSQDVIDQISIEDVEGAVSHKINGEHSNHRISEAVSDDGYIIDNEVDIDPAPEEWIIVATRADNTIKTFIVPTPDHLQNKEDRTKLLHCTAILVEQEAANGNSLNNIVLGTKGPRQEFGRNAVYSGEEIQSPDFLAIKRNVNQTPAYPEFPVISAYEAPEP